MWNTGISGDMGENMLFISTLMESWVNCLVTAAWVICLLRSLMKSKALSVNSPVFHFSTWWDVSFSWPDRYIEVTSFESHIHDYADIIHFEVTPSHLSDPSNTKPPLRTWSWVRFYPGVSCRLRLVPGSRNRWGVQMFYGMEVSLVFLSSELFSQAWWLLHCQTARVQTVSELCRDLSRCFGKMECHISKGHYWSGQH